jgi:multicomponent Na+:H+ antiporter subunit E
MTLPRQITLYALFLFAVWLGWSGYLKVHLLLLGVVSCAAVLLLVQRMHVGYPQERFWLRLLPRLPGFWLWLFWEVVKSNVKLARIMLSPRPAVSPTLVTITAESEDGLGQAILGNCITLTPGTVTLDDHDGKLQVHCITRQNADELKAGVMNRRIAALTRS